MEKNYRLKNEKHSTVRFIYDIYKKRIEERGSVIIINTYFFENYSLENFISAIQEVVNKNDISNTTIDDWIDNEVLSAKTISNSSEFEISDSVFRFPRR